MRVTSQRGISGGVFALTFAILIVIGGVAGYLAFSPGHSSFTSSTSSTSSSPTVPSSTSTIHTTSTSSASTTTYTSPASSNSSSSPTSNSITVTSHDLHNGSSLVGFFVDLRLNNNHIESGYTPVTFSGLRTGVQYLVVVYWYGNYYFRHFADGNLNRYALVTLNNTSGQTTYALNALYEYVPKSQAALLNIIAQFPNGTQIGTATQIDGYPQHSPGMWLTVTPPGSTIPFTATFTGGSILPFTFFYGQTYMVEMSSGYANIHFSHWKDDGSTNPDRSITLNDSSTYIAIYTVTP